MADHIEKIAVDALIDEHDSIHLRTAVRDSLFIEVVKTKEQAIAEALIQLGWTPPSDHPALVLVLAVVEAAAAFVDDSVVFGYPDTGAYWELQKAVKAWRGAQNGAHGI